MKLNFRIPELPPEGGQSSKVHAVYESTPTSTGIDRLMIVFELENNKKIHQQVLVQNFEHSLLRQLFEAALGEMPENPDTDDLIGKSVAVEVAYKSHEGKQYANVVAAGDLADWQNACTEDNGSVEAEEEW